MQATIELVEQYLTVLTHLAARASEEIDGGWALTRPLLFHAHHTAELAIKAALIGSGLVFESRHSLRDLWATLGTASGATEVAGVDVDWCGRYIALVADLAGNSIGARYARPNKGHASIDETWCCVNPLTLAEATEQFAIQCFAIAQECWETPTHV